MNNGLFKKKKKRTTNTNTGNIRGKGFKFDKIHK